MPELPEVEHLRRGLLGGLVGRCVVGVVVHRRDVVAGPADPAGGYSRLGRRASGVARYPRLDRGLLLMGQRIERLERRGKQLALIGGAGGAVVVHLGMSGQLLLLGRGERRRRMQASEPPAGDHVHVTWRLHDGSRLLFRDPRRFGGVWAFESEVALLESRWSVLGVDALEVDGVSLADGLGGSRTAVKARLMDQRVVAGVGNIYADESLHRAGISPLRASEALSGEECERLAGCLRSVLGRAIAAGGSTVRDYADARGAAGAYQGDHMVYGRGGEACMGCGHTLAQGVVAQRTTVWCPSCQR